MANVAALMIPYDFLDKVFLTHLHTDHWGDLATLWAGGWTAGRTKSLRVWVPMSGVSPLGPHILSGFVLPAVQPPAQIVARSPK